MFFSFISISQYLEEFNLILNQFSITDTDQNDPRELHFSPDQGGLDDLQSNCLFTK